MCRKLILLIFLFSGFGLVSPILAGRDWTNSGGNNLWVNPNNWSGSVLPTAGETTNVNKPSSTDSCIVTSGVGAQCGWLNIADPCTAEVEVQSGGILTSTGDAKIMVGGNSSGCAGELNIYGDVNASQIQIGYDASGDTTVYSAGELYIGWLAQIGGESTGTLTVDGGDAWIKHLTIANDDGTGTVEVKNKGTLYVDSTMRLASNWDGTAGTDGTAVINLYDGLINVGWHKKAACDNTQINIYDGLMKVGYGGFNIGNDEVLDIWDGSFFFAGYGGESSIAEALTLVDSYVSNGNLEAYNGSGTIYRVWSEDDWGVYITGFSESAGWKWTNNTGNNLWGDTSNWNCLERPDTCDIVHINKAGSTDSCIVASSAKCGWLWIASPYTAKIQVRSGGTLTSTGDTKVMVGGNSGGCAGELDIYGDVNAGQIQIGYDASGDTTVYSTGELYIGWLAQIGGESIGTLTVDSGDAWIKHLTIADDDGTGTVEVKNSGTLYIDDTMRLASNWDGTAGTDGIAVINLYDGLIDVGWHKKAACDSTQINIYDGLMKVGYGGFNIGNDEVLDIWDGSFFFAGYGGEASIAEALTLVDSYASSGNLEAYNGSGTIYRVWSEDDWGVYITGFSESVGWSWTNNAGNSLWDNPNNWNCLALPDACDTVNIAKPRSTKSCIVTSGVDAKCGWLYVSDPYVAKLEVQEGGTLTSTGDTKIIIGGNSSGCAGELDIYGDVNASQTQIGYDASGDTTVYSTGNLYIGWLAQIGGESTGNMTVDGGDAWIKHLTIADDDGTGIVEVRNDGTLYVDDTMRLASNWDGTASTDGTAVINLYDGLIDVGWHKKAACDNTQINIYDGLMKVGYGGFNIGNDEVLNIWDGSFFFAGYGGEAGSAEALALVDSYVASGNIEAYDGAGTIEREWSSGDWGVHITGVFESEWADLESWIESPWTDTDGGTSEPDGEDLARPWQMQVCRNDTEQVLIGLMNTSGQSIDVNVLAISSMPADRSSVELLVAGGIESRNNGNVLVNLFTPSQIASFDGNFPYRFTNTDVIRDFPALHLPPNTPVRLWLRVKTTNESTQQYLEPGQYRIGFQATDGSGNNLSRMIEVEVLPITLPAELGLESVTYGGINNQDNRLHHTTVDVGKDCGGHNHYTFYNILGAIWDYFDQFAEWKSADPCGFQEAVELTVDTYLADQLARGFSESQILLEIHDEPEDNMADDWVAMADSIKDYRPESKIIANPVVGANVTLEGTFEELDPYVDIWMPHVYNYDNSGIKNFLQNTGKPLWFYKNCTLSEARLEKACCGFLRRGAWSSLKYDLDGLGFWTAYGPVGDPWDDFDGDNPDPAIVFECGDSCEPPIATRAWEAWRETHEDAAIYKLIEEAMVQNTISPSKASQAASWLSNSPDTVLDVSEDDFIGTMDSILSEALYLLEGVYSSVTSLFIDGFESGNYTAGDWTKQNTNADVSIWARYTGIYGARLKRTTWIQKRQSTSGYRTIHVKYNRKTAGMSSTEWLTADWSIDGSTWHNLETTNDTSWGFRYFTCAIGANDNSDFRIRFRTNGDSTADYAYIDDVEITGTSQ